MDNSIAEKMKRQRAVNWFIRLYIDCAMCPIVVHNRKITDEDFDSFVIVESRIREVCTSVIKRDYVPLNIFKRINGNVCFDALSVWGWIRNNSDVVFSIREFKPIAEHYKKLMEYTEFVNTTEKQGISMETAEGFQREAVRRFKQLEFDLKSAI